MPRPLSLDLAVAFTAAALCGCYTWLHPMPKGTSFEGPLRPAQDVRFLADLTWVDDAGQRHVEQQIFDAIFDLIRRAEHYVVIDMFLWNDFQGDEPETTRALASELTEVLIARKRARPDMTIVAISDPVNTVYGGVESKHFRALREAGIQVVITRLDRLRDSNPGYSGFWRIFARPLGQPRGGALPSPFSNERVNVLSYLALLNFKANHRKVVVADGGSGGPGAVAIVTSANPHDGSSAHGNVALGFAGTAAFDLIETEKAVIALSDGEVPTIAPAGEAPSRAEEDGPTLQLLTEEKIRRALLEALGRARAGDRIDVAVFYLSDRGIVSALTAARARGAAVRVLLDPNKDAFGYEKNGVPNQPVAVDLRRGDVVTRWCDTHGEQCHAKLLLARYASGEAVLILGSANFTRRNLQDLNLETNVALRGPQGLPAIRDASAWFELLWSNAPGRRFSVEYDAFADEALRKRFQYRVEEGTGLSTF
jgi:phosphatidylserine/phosphatidylglycerophosphate/cardiolipin synthase-like enzyme